VNDLRITPYTCPLCIGGLMPSLEDEGTEKCHHCAGTSLTKDPLGHAELAPRPPAVMRTPCADCAFRRDSPELNGAGFTLPTDEPFYCHQGVPIDASGRYQATASFRGLPLGLMVCAGWWAFKTGQPLPTTPYREVPRSPDCLGDR
jgi:hypothetical protein